MKRDMLKTVAGLFIIAVIVVATFLYGNAQRQAQQRRDAATKSPQVAAASPTASAKVSSPVVTATPKASATPAPKASATPAPKPTATPTPTKSPAAGAVAGQSTTTPTAGASVPLPATGPAEAAAPALGLAAMVAGLVLWRRSRRNVLAAARTISRG